MSKFKITILIFLVGAVGAGYYFLFYKQDKAGNTAVDNTFGWKYPIAMFPNVGPNDQNLIAYSDIRDPGGMPQGLPVRLKIPAIDVDSAIEDAYITPDGRMDVPVGTVNVAWFALGPHPGNIGSAVIGGHFGIDNGIPRIFYNLDKLKEGDKVYIVDDNNDTLAFVVRSIKLFDRNADATTVFTSSDGLAHLNLVTCEGVWNRVNDTYPDRRVVFTDAIPSEGPIVIKPKLPDTSKEIPITVSPTPISKEKIEFPSNEKNPPLDSENLVQSAKSLYATPIDGLITSSLLVAIGVVAHAIRRRKYVS